MQGKQAAYRSMDEWYDRNNPRLGKIMRQLSLTATVSRCADWVVPFKLALSPVFVSGFLLVGMVLAVVTATRRADVALAAVVLVIILVLLKFWATHRFHSLLDRARAAGVVWRGDLLWQALEQALTRHQLSVDTVFARYPQTMGAHMQNYLDEARPHRRAAEDAVSHMWETLFLDGQHMHAAPTPERQALQNIRTAAARAAGAMKRAYDS